MVQVLTLAALLIAQGGFRVDTESCDPLDALSEIVSELRQQGTADDDSVEFLEQQFVANPVEG